MTQEERGGDERLPAGEQPFRDVEEYERPEPMRLLSGKLFRVEDKDFAATSNDEGRTWQRGGRIRPVTIGHCHNLRDYEIQIQEGPYRGRLVAPFEIGLHGEHPDYTREVRGGYAIWRGEKIRLQTHTHVPEMGCAFFRYSDDEGQTWQSSKGFVMGYIGDGHLGHWPCQEPAVAEGKDGRLFCLMRSTCGGLLQSTSSDGGESWTFVTLSGLAASNSPCAMVRLPQTGDVAIVWNQVSVEEIERGYRRGRLSLAVTRDGGVTWRSVRTLELSAGLEDVERLEPPVEPTPMVRGPSGPDELMGELPDGFSHFHYPNLFVVGDEVHVVYIVSNPAGEGVYRWREILVRDI